MNLRLIEKTVAEYEAELGTPSPEDWRDLIGQAFDKPVPLYPLWALEKLPKRLAVGG